MTFLFSRLGRYIVSRTLGGILVIMAAIGATIVLVDLVEQMRSVGARTGISAFEALQLTGLKIPHLVEQTLPFVVLTGTMLGLNQLNRRSELIAIRAAGVSAWRFLWPAAALALVIGLFSSLALNPIAAQLYEGFETRKELLLSDRVGVQPEPERVWLRQGDDISQMVITAANVDVPNGALTEAIIFVFDVTPQGALNFSRRLFAARAELRQGFWQLSGVVEATPGGAPVRQEHLAIPTTIDSAAFLDRFETARTLSFWRLPGAIRQAQAAGLSATRYELRWHNLLAAPAMMAAMAALGAVFSLRLHRLGGLASWTLSGLVAGFLLYFLAQFASAFSAAEVVPPVLAAWAPPVAGFFGAMALLSQLEDG
jgi:lipopolysaccharide export system permease protein